MTTRYRIEIMNRGRGSCGQKRNDAMRIQHPRMPDRLHNAYDWTWSAVASSNNAAVHLMKVSVYELIDLHDWLNR